MITGCGYDKDKFQRELIFPHPLIILDLEEHFTIQDKNMGSLNIYQDIFPTLGMYRD